jgi:branched-chain amino acid transport system substrate-binding protein
MTIVGRGAAGALVVALLLLSAPVQSQERGVTPTEVVIGTSQPLTGPASFWGIPVTGGMDAYIKLTNEGGGINGRKIRLVALDDGYQPPRAVANVRELVERTGVFAIVGLLGSANAFAVRDYIVENKVLWINPLADASMWTGFKGKQYLFVTYVSYTDEGRLLTEYAVKSLGVTTFAVFYQNDLFGKKGLTGVKRGADSTKTRIVAAVPYEVTDRDYSAYAVKLRESKADALVLYSTPTAAAQVVKEMAKIGYRPRLISTSALADPAMFALAGEAWNDVILAAYFPLPTTDSKVDEVVATIAKGNPALARAPFNTAAGVSFVEPFLEGLRRAGPTLTRDKFVSAMETIRNWDGDVVRGVTFGPERRQGVARIYIVKTEGGQYKRLTPDIAYPVGF